MISAESLAHEIVVWVGNRTMLNAEARKDLQRFVEQKVEPLAPRQQPSLTFEDREALEGQSAAILALLKQRRSSGALSHELATASLKYTGRVSDLRAAGYRITCKRESGRSHRYILHPESW